MIEREYELRCLHCRYHGYLRLWTWDVQTAARCGRCGQAAGVHQLPPVQPAVDHVEAPSPSEEQQ